MTRRQYLNTEVNYVTGHPVICCLLTYLNYTLSMEGVGIYIALTLVFFFVVVVVVVFSIFDLVNFFYVQ